MQFWSLTDYLPYESVRQLQLRLVELRVLDQIPDTILFLEHSPVITRGRGLQFTGEARPRHMPVPALIPPGIEFTETERGGDLTYHGPGQLVIYPICKMDGTGFAPERDLAVFLRKTEGLLIQELKDRGLAAGTQDSATGVWIGSKKVASIGIAVRKWVSFHGMAINVVNDLAPFSLISPCGFSPEVMTRLKDWLPLTESWRDDLESALARRFMPAAPIRVEKMTLSEAHARLESRTFSASSLPSMIP